MKSKNKIDYDKELMEVLSRCFPNVLDQDLKTQKKIDDRDKFIDSILKEKKRK